MLRRNWTCPRSTDGYELSFRPCLPSHWPRAELTLQRDGRTMRFIVLRQGAADALAATASMRCELLHPGDSLAWRGLAAHACFVIALLLH